MNVDDPQLNTGGLTQAVQQLPELLARKTIIEKHSDILTALMKVRSCSQRHTSVDLQCVGLFEALKAMATTQQLLLWLGKFSQGFHLPRRSFAVGSWTSSTIWKKICCKERQTFLP